MLRRWAALGLCAAAALGCANHVRFDEEVREHESRDVTRAATRIDAPAPVVASPALELVVSVDETVLVRRRETLVRLDEETPWRLENELWEVPTGLVAVPFFVGVRASNKLCLGLIPQDFIDGGTDFAFAALNPALNVESETRVEGREVSRSTRELKPDEERSTRPLAGAAVTVALGHAPAVALSTDATGRLHVDLLALVDGVRARAAAHEPDPGAPARRRARARDGTRASGERRDRCARSLRARGDGLPGQRRRARARAAGAPTGEHRLALAARPRAV